MIIERCATCAMPVDQNKFCSGCALKERRRIRRERRSSKHRPPESGLQTTLTLEGASMRQQLAWWGQNPVRHSTATPISRSGDVVEDDHSPRSGGGGSPPKPKHR